MKAVAERAVTGIVKGPVKVSAKARWLALALAGGLLVTVASVAVLILAAASGFRRRRLYAAVTTQLARLLLRMGGITLRRHGVPPAAGQVVFVSNHSSTLDLFVLVALGLPNTRFFLSGFLQRLIPLGILARLMGTFFTVPQDRTGDRRRLFARACAELTRTGESVYLSPEGGRITSGRIGAFNKGAFHLATALPAPIVPIYLSIPARIDPGLGYAFRPGVVDVFFAEPVDTRTWRLDDVALNRDRVRDLFIRWHRATAVLRHAEPETCTPVAATA